MKNIALISHTSNFGGAERMLINLALLLKNSLEYNPIIFIPNGGTRLLKEECDKENIETVEVENSEEYIFLKNENLYDKLINTKEYMVNLEQYFIDYDIKLVINNTSTLISPVIAAHKLKLPVVTWIHGILSSYSIPVEFDPELRYLFEKFLILFSDKIFSLLLR